MATPIGDRTLRVAVVGAGRMANSVHYPSLACWRMPRSPRFGIDEGG